MKKEFDTWRCLPKNQEWIISNRENLVELHGDSIENREYAEDGVVTTLR